jgi:hypothetical protein
LANLKKHSRAAIEALRRLGVEPPKQPTCQHRGFGFRGACPYPVTRLREDWDGVKRWYCAHHDPIRVDQEHKNRAKRDAEKKERWKRLEAERKR